MKRKKPRRKKCPCIDLARARLVVVIVPRCKGKQLAGIHYNPQAIHDGPP